MSKQEQKVIEGVRPHLAPGEEPLVAIVAQPKGTSKAAAGTGVLGAAGVGARLAQDLTAGAVTPTCRG